MVQQNVDFDADKESITEWDDWYKLVQEGYDCFMHHNSDAGLKLWKEAEEVFFSIIKVHYVGFSFDTLTEELDYNYSIDGWLQDYELELANASKYDERIIFCQSVLDIFDWEDCDRSSFMCGIGDSLFCNDRKEEAYKYYENWLTEETLNINGINGFSWILFEDGKVDKAYALVKNVTWGNACHHDNFILFVRANEFAISMGKQDEGNWYEQQLNKYQSSLKDWADEDEEIFDEFTGPKRIPVIKSEKIDRSKRVSDAEIRSKMQ